MQQATRYIGIGGGLTLVTLIAALGTSALLGFDWLLVAFIALVAVGAVALALTFTPTPTEASDGSWSQFTGVRGDGFNVVGSAFFGSRASTGHQESTWNTQAVVNSALPLLAATGLLVYWILR